MLGHESQRRNSNGKRDKCMDCVGYNVEYFIYLLTSVIHSTAGQGLRMNRPGRDERCNALTF